MDHSSNILASWEANAENWIATIDNEEIESRKIVTNAAILNTISGYSFKRILDIGCGEGWLTRALQERGCDADGIDAVDTLVNNAIKKGGPSYYQGSFKDLVSGSVALPGAYDSVVINFALLDKEDVEQLILYLPTFIKSGGLVFIQTLHPYSIAASDNYVSGWKEGSWNGLKQPFVLPYQWYFRTLQDWYVLFKQAGFNLLEIKEPVHPQTQKPLSIIFVLKVP